MTKQDALNKIKELESYIEGLDSFQEPEMVEIENLTIKPFAIGKYQVTQKLWKSVMGNNPSLFTGNDMLPVETVSWNDVQEFLKELNKKTGKQYRLPTEHEWLVCATIDGTMYSGSNDIDEVAWYWKNSENKTHPVGLKKPNIYYSFLYN